MLIYVVFNLVNLGDYHLQHRRHCTRGVELSLMISISLLRRFVGQAINTGFIRQGFVMQ